MGFPRQEYWNVLPLPSPGDLPNLRIELESPVLAGGLFTILTGKKEKKKTHRDTDQKSTRATHT